MRLAGKTLIVELIVALAGIMPSAAANKTIFVFSDIHLMAPSLLDSPDNKQWKNDLANSKIMMDLSIPMFDLLVEKTIAEKPDLVLITGDLTKDGEVESHECVKERLEKISKAGIKILLIPGNHDRGYMDNALVYANDTSTTAKTFNNPTFFNYYKEYGFDDNSILYDNSMNYVTEPLPGLSVIGIDTGIWCQYRDDVVDWACQQAEAARKKGNLPLLMQHHPLMPHYYSQEQLFELWAPEDYMDVRERLANAGIRAVLSGHTHTSDICRYTSSQGHDIFDINNGSPISYPCDFRVLSLSGNTLKVSTRSLCDDMDQQDEKFSSNAKYRLTLAVKRWAERWLAKKDIINDFFTTELAYCFVIHAEGDEPENPGSSNELAFFRIIHELAARELSEEAVEMLGHVREVVKSMLGDYQTPEEPDNIIKDRELTIDMSFNAPVGIREVEAADPDTDEWHTLQGVRLQARPMRPGAYIHNGRIQIVR